MKETIRNLEKMLIVGSPEFDTIYHTIEILKRVDDVEGIKEMLEDKRFDNDFPPINYNHIEWIAQALQCWLKGGK